MSDANGTIQSLVQQKHDVIGADILRHTRRHVTDVAKQLSNAGAAAASAEICNEAVCKLIDLCYEQDATGRCNIDPDGRLLVPAPWGRNGRYKYGLRATQGDVLRLHLQELQSVRRPAPLFTYDPLVYSWYCNIFDYVEKDQALRYWRTCQLDASTYAQLTETVRNRRRGSA